MRALLLALFAMATMAASGTAAPATRRLAIRVDAPPWDPARAVGRATIVLERCRGGCLVTYGDRDDARTTTSSVPQGPGLEFRVGEFVNGEGQRGGAADVEWAAVLQCVREVYSPYAVDVTDVRPTSGDYHLAILAGSPADVGYPRDVLGVAPLSNECDVLENAVSFSFASVHGTDRRVTNLCWTVAQESAHAYGLDHVFEQVDGTSACNDPMTYRVDCGGQKFFRAVAARCGTTRAVDCQCGATQRSHDALLARLGPGALITPAPTITLDEPPPGSPGASDGPLPPTVTVTAGSPRGIDRVELLLNGYPWASARGVPFGPDGQPTAAYTLTAPPGLPPGVFDLVVRAHEDLPERFTDTAMITRVNGAPCASDAVCLANQRCTAGRCAWAPPTGELGDACEYPQFCASDECHADTCTQACDPSGPNGAAGLPACPADFSCGTGGALAGFCVPASGGCCSAAAGPGAALPGLVAVLFALRRRRRMR